MAGPTRTLLGDDASSSTVVRFADGEPLVRAGDPADHVLVLVSGRARVQTTDGSVLDTLGKGDLVGEISLLAGGARTADVISVGPTTARRFDRPDFMRLLDEHPDLASAVGDELTRRIDEHRILSFMEKILGSAEPIPFADLRDRLSWRWVRAGECLYRDGDAATSGFLVISGRLRVLVPGATERGPWEIGPEEFVGESGLFEERRRRVTVEAIRDSLVAEVTREAVLELLVRHPRTVAPLMMRLARPARRGRGMPARRTIAVSVTADVDRRVFTSRIVSEMGRHRTSSHVWSDWVDSVLAHPGAAHAALGDPAHPRLAQLLHELELATDHVVLEIDQEWTGWSETASRHADRLVACIDPEPSEAALRSVDTLFGAGTPHAERVLVVIHSPATDRPRHTSRWVDRWNPDRILHVVAGSAADMARLSRILAGRSHGLVLGGGGAKGFAHLGVRRAMLELGIPLDHVGGTSIGSPLAVGMAMGMAQDELEKSVELLFKGLLDYTIPVVSLIKGERITASIQEGLGGWNFEDLWLPCFCISTNLTRSIEMNHRRGDLVHAVRASISIPGVMPPVPWGDDLLVDGGVLNNLPADVMRRDVEEGTVIAVDVAPPSGPRSKGETALSVSGWEALRSRAGRGKASYPGVTAMLMRTMIAGSIRERGRMLDRGAADLYLDLDLRGVSLLDFERVRPVAQAGYEAAMPRLEAWLAGAQRTEA